MRAAGLISAHARVEVSPGSLRVPQDFQAANGKRAAHYLPGFVAVKDAGKGLRYMWDFVSDKGTRDEIAGLFRATQDLPPTTTAPTAPRRAGRACFLTGSRRSSSSAARPWWTWTRRARR